MMRLAVMQPYFLPYIGYFQLLAAVDSLVVYDNIKYTKKGWINRNRILRNGNDALLSLPLRNASDSLNICERELSAAFDRTNVLNQIKGAYHHAPYFSATLPLVKRVLECQDDNLFRFIFNSIVQTCAHLDIKTSLLVSSQVTIDHTLKGQDKVLAFCNELKASIYVNAIGGAELYGKDEFWKKGVELRFIKSAPFEYVQYGDAFVPWLSILDVLMFNPLEIVKERIATGYELV